jgi:hypothetical protein
MVPFPSWSAPFQVALAVLFGIFISPQSGGW